MELDTVIQVSEVAVPSLTPEEQVLGALLDRTLSGVQLHLPPPPAPKSMVYLCTCSVRRGASIWRYPQYPLCKLQKFHVYLHRTYL